MTCIEINNYNKADLNYHVYEVGARIEKVNTYEDYQMVICDSVQLNGLNGGKTNYKIRLFVYGDRDLCVGDRIYFNAVLKDNGTHYNSRFSAEQINDKIKYTAKVDGLEILVTSNEATIFQKINRFISNSLKDGLSGDEYGVAFAMLTGDSSFIDGEVLQNFRLAGIAHVFAVSGLHVGVLAVAITFIFLKLKLNKKISALLTVLICFFYSGVCGFSSSSIRATIMCAVSLIANLSGRKYDGISSICFAGIVILIFSPLQLFCVGFQLSFGVVLGIFTIGPYITKIFKFLPNKFAKSLGVAISAQIVSIPILLYAFSSFTLVSVLFNVVMIPVISPLFVVLLFATILGGIFSVSSVLLFPLKYVLTFLIAFINFFDYGIFMISGIVFGAYALLYYGVFIVLSDKINLKRTAKAIICVSLSIAFVIGVTFKSINEYKSIKCYVSGGENFSAVMLKSKDENVLVLSVSSTNFSLNKLKTLKNHASVEGVDKIIFSSYFLPEETQELYTKIKTVLSAEEIYYYGEQDLSLENVIENSFRSTVAINYLDDNKLNFSDGAITFDCDGRVVLVSINGNEHAIITQIGSYDKCIYERINNCASVIAYDYQDYFLSSSKTTNKISFVDYQEYLSAESDGIFKYNLK